jgi:hypothetical protein
MMDKWFEMLREERDQRQRPEQTPFKSKAQKQYKALRRKNDIYSTVAGHKNLSVGAPFDNKAERAGTDRLRFEEVEREAFEKHQELQPKFWFAGRLNPKVSRRLIKIIEEFAIEAGEQSGLGAPVEVEDIRLVGSLANYNWSKYSDIDLHVVVDFSKISDDVELVESLFHGAIWRWNELHDIMIYGHEVEIFVENVGHHTRSRGIYSIMNNEWISEPDAAEIEFDYATARKKADAFQTEINLIDRFILEKPRSALKSIERLKQKIRRFRMAGLHSPAEEYSIENIAFKILRREEALDRLNNMKYDTYDRILSIW